MTTKTMKHFSLSALAALVGLATTSVPSTVLARTDVDARLSTDELRVGEAAHLVVTVTGDEAQQPRVPSVPGVVIEPLGRSESVVITNGRLSSSVDHVFAVVPQRAGDFTIPPIAIGDARTAPLRAHASPGGARASSPARAQPNAPQGVAPRGGGRRAFARIHVDADQAIVGEAVPVRIKAYFRPDTSAQIGAPKLEDDAFLVDGLSAPVQREETVRGEPYGTMTWTGTITPLLEGEHDLPLEIPVELQWRELEPAPASSDVLARFFGGDPFGSDPLGGGSLFDALGSMMGPSWGPPRSASVTLEHADRITVVPPPSEGRPEGFTGAVGTFSLAAEVDTREVAVGEPVTLTVHVRGEGNFDRVELSMVEDGATARAYAPQSELHPDHEGSRSATKTFRQSVVPTAAGELELAPITLSYFDPDRREYVTLATDAQHISVRPGSHGALVAGDLSEVAPSDGLARSSSRDEVPVATLLPMVPSPLTILGFPALVMLLALTAPPIARRTWRAWSARHAERTTARQVREHLARAERAARQGDARATYLACRAALQHRLSRALGMADVAITLADVEARLDPVPAPLRAAFERADAADYAELPDGDTDLVLFTERVRALLRDLETR